MPISGNIFENSSLGGATVNSIVHDGLLPVGITLDIDVSLNGDVTFTEDGSYTEHGTKHTCAFTVVFQSGSCPCTKVIHASFTIAGVVITCAEFNSLCPTIVNIDCGIQSPAIQFLAGSSEWLDQVSPCPDRTNIFNALQAISAVSSPVYRSDCTLEFSAVGVNLWTSTVSIDVSSLVLEATITVRDPLGAIKLQFTMHYEGGCTPLWEIGAAEYRYADLCVDQQSPPQDCLGQIKSVPVGADCVDLSQPTPTLILNPGGGSCP